LGYFFLGWAALILAATALYLFKKRRDMPVAMQETITEPAQ
jgi:hypothetical protein